MDCVIPALYYSALQEAFRCFFRHSSSKNKCSPNSKNFNNCSSPFSAFIIDLTESTGGTKTEASTSYTIQLNIFTVSNYISVVCLNWSYWHMKENLIVKTHPYESRTFSVSSVETKTESIL